MFTATLYDKNGIATNIDNSAFTYNGNAFTGATNANTYVIKVSLNNCESFTVEYIIEKATPTITISDASLIFGNSITLNGICSNGGSLTYSTESDDYLTITNTTAKAIKVTPSNGIEVKASYAGNSNYNSVNKTFIVKVEQASMTNVTVSLNSDYVLLDANGIDLSSILNIKLGDYPLVYGTDYTCDTSNITEVGTFSITLNGINSFKGSKSINITVKKNISSTNVSLDKSKFIVKESELSSFDIPVPIVSDENNTLVLNTDYTINNPAISGFGEYSITIIGKGNYCGETTVKFTVEEYVEETVAILNSVEYTTVKEALDNAVSGDIVYIIPRVKDGKTADTYITKKGVTVILPYSYTDGKENHFGEENGNKPIAFVNSDKYLKNNLVIQAGSQLINNGELIIGGITSGGGGGIAMAGHTSGYFSQITLEKDSKLTNNGKITSYGFIDASNGGLIVNTSTGTIIIPFVVGEHRGGSAFSSLFFSGLKGAPFHRFYFPNILGDIEHHYGSELIAKADLFASDKHNYSDVAIIGTSNVNLLQMKDGSIIKTHTTLTDNVFYDNGVATKDRTGETKIKVDTYGDININSLSIVVKHLVEIPISTSDVLMPIPWYYDINLHLPEKGSASATVSSASQGIILLPGSNVTIDPGVNLVVDRFVVYNNTTEDLLSFAKLKYPTDVSARLLVNGNVTANKLAGNVETNQLSANIVVLNNNTETCYFVNGSEWISDSSAVLSLKQYNNGIIGDYTLAAVNSYYSYYDGNEYGWIVGTTETTINYEFIGVTGTVNNPNGTSITLNTELELENPVVEGDESSQYTFIGWYYQNKEFVIEDIDGRRLAFGLKIK